MKNAENLDAKELLEVPLIKCEIAYSSISVKNSESEYIEIVISENRTSFIQRFCCSFVCFVKLMHIIELGVTI